jgi:hypothetical protein
MRLSILQVVVIAAMLAVGWTLSNLPQVKIADSITSRCAGLDASKMDEMSQTICAEYRGR